MTDWAMSHIWCANIHPDESEEVPHSGPKDLGETDEISNDPSEEKIRGRNNNTFNLI
jgi:hypothetical protein